MTEAPLTFWSQDNPYVRYMRCEMPAKVLGCKVRHADVTRWTGLEHSDVNEGVAIWQILCNANRLNFARKMLWDGIPVFGEVDDDYTRWDESVANSQWVAGMPEHPNQASVELHRRAMTLVEGIICATPALAEVYSVLNPNVYVCPNSVDLDDWQPPLPRDDETFRILWMASGSHKIDQKLVLPALDWASEQPGVEVYFFGPIISKADKIMRVSWVDDPQEYRNKLVELKPDIGICPIRDTLFTRGKSDLKALEYSMTGALPIVSPLEPYRDWLDLVPTAKNTQEWTNAIKWAIGHKDEVRQLAKRCYEYVTTQRTSILAAPAWLDAINVPLHELEENSAYH